jgi:hypothetical protein
MYAATAWENTEFRSYHFVDPTGKDPAAALIETDGSMHQRFGHTNRPSFEEHNLLRSDYFVRAAKYFKTQKH